MDRPRPDQGWRALAMAVALFAITLNFLQPLAHAALLRDGAPSALWSVFCNATAADPDGKSGSLPMAAQDHECCLGLAHVTAFVPPPTAFVLVEPIAAVAVPLLPLEQPTPVGIRDGPSQPRGPPTLV
jgi:Protein of unknown function (DUF2946)